MFFVGHPELLIILAVAFFCLGIPLMKILLVQKERRKKSQGKLRDKDSK